MWLKSKKSPYLAGEKSNKILVRQQEALLSLLENWDKYKDLVETSRTSRGTAEMKYDAYRDSLEASMNRLTATFEEFTNKAEINNLIKTLVDIQTTMTSLLNVLVKWLPAVLISIDNMKIVSGNSTLQRIADSKYFREFFNGRSELLDLRKRMKDSNFEGEHRGLDNKFSTGFRVLMGGRTNREERFLKKENEAKIKSLKDEKKIEEDITKQSQIRAESSKEELANKEAVVAKSDVEAANKDKVSTNSERDVALSREKSSNEQVGATMVKNKTKDEQTVAMARKQGKSSEDTTLQSRVAGKDVEATIAAQRRQASLKFLSYAINQAMIGLSAYTTSGTTHGTGLRGMDSVNSSERAHTASRAISTFFSTAIPFVGKIIGDSIGEYVARDIDSVRDLSTYQTKEAGKILDVISGLKGNMETLSNLASSTNSDDVAAREAAMEEYVNTLYLSENSDTRTLLEKYLPQITQNLGLSNNSINGLAGEYKKGNKETREKIVRALEIAQKKAEISKLEEKNASESYAYRERLSQKALNYETANGRANNAAQRTGAIGAGLTTGLGTAAIVGGIASLFSGPVGWGLLAAGLIGGALVGHATGKWFMSESREEAVRGSYVNNLLTDEKIDYLTEEETKIREAIEKADKNNVGATQKLQDQLLATIEYRKAAQDYKEYISQKNREYNKLYLEEAMLEAKDSRGRYITDLNTSQLEGIDPSELYKALADKVENTLVGITIKNSDGEFTQEFISLATEILKKDEDISSFLSGSNLTLSEALKKLNPSDQFDRKRLENFANALGVDIDSLGGLESSYGMLTLSELMQGTDELSKTTSTYIDLLSSISDGQKSVSEWMNTIVNQFPELISYMGDIPSLMDAAMEKIKQMSDRYVRTQWEEYSKSDEYFSKNIRPNILASFTGEDGKLTDEGRMIEGLLQDSGAKNVSSLMDWIVGKGAGREGIQTLKEALLNAFGDSTVVSDIFKNKLSEYIEANTKAMDKEIDNLTKQRDMLQEINSQREYENKLIEARNKLEEAQNEKRRVYREGVGWVYEADQQKVAEAKESLDEVSREKDVSALTKQIETLTATRDEWSNIWEKKNYYLLQEQAKSFEKTFDMDSEGSLGGKLSMIYTLMDGISTSVKTLATEDLEGKKEKNEKLLKGDSSAEKGSSASKSLTQLWNEYRNAVGTEKENDALESFTKRYQEYSNAGGDTDAWFESLSEGERTSPKGSASEIGSGGYDKFKVTPTKTLYIGGATGDGASFNNGFRYNGESLPASESNEIFADMKKTKGGHSQARLWKQSIADGSLKGGDYIGKKWYNISSEDSSLAEYARRLYSMDNGLANNENLIIQGTKSGKWAYITDNGQRIQKLSPSGLRLYRKDYVINGKSLGYGTNYKVLQDVYSMGSDHIFTEDGKSYEYPAGEAVDSQKLLEWGLVKETDEAPTEDTYAKGTFSKKGSGVSLVNELGTEAIVTPSGTVTALPSRTGVVPADITRNLWELGELAPGIMRALQMPILSGGIGNSALSPVYDDSLSVNNINMVVNADGSFDADRFVQSLRDRVALTRNNRK